MEREPPVRDWNRVVGHGAALTVAGMVALFAVLVLVSLGGVTTPDLSFASVLTSSVAFVVMQVAVLQLAPTGLRIFAVLAVSFGIMFSTYICLAYYVQLAVVRTNPLDVSEPVLRLVRYAPGSVAFALDMLGFSFLCLSVLALYPLFAATGGRALKAAILVNGVLALPTFLFPIFFIVRGSAPSEVAGSIVMLVWCVIFLPVPVLLARWLKPDL